MLFRIYGSKKSRSDHESPPSPVIDAEEAGRIEAGATDEASTVAQQPVSASHAQRLRRGCREVIIAKQGALEASLFNGVQ